jgi:PAS domain S-box-containing protein
MFALLRRRLDISSLTDPVERRLAPLFQIILTILTIMTVGMIIYGFIFVGVSQQNITGYILIFAFLAVALVALNWLRHGNFRWTVWIVILALLLIQIPGLLNNDLSLHREQLLNYVLPTVFAGLLLGRRALIIVFSICFAMLVVAATRVSNPAVLPSVFIQFFVIIGISAVLFHLFGNTLRSELRLSIAQSDELFRLSERLEVTLASIGDAVITTDPQGRVQFLNIAAQSITGWSQEAAVGQRLPDVFRIVNEETRQTVESPFDKVIREGKVVGLANHTILLAKDGREVPIDDSGAPIRDNHGDIIGVVLVFRDIVERRGAERRLVQQSQLINLAFDAILVLDTDSRILFWNRAAEELYGRSADEVLGKVAYEVLRTEYPISRQQLIETARQEGHWQGELVHYRRDGAQLIVDSRWAYVDDFDGQPALMEINRDITARKRAEQRIQLLQEVTGALSEAVTPVEVGTVIIERARQALGASYGSVCVLGRDGRTLDMLPLPGISDAILKHFEGATIDSPVPVAEAVRTELPIWLESREQYLERFPQMQDAVAMNGSQSAAALPLLVRGRIVGGMMLSFPAPRQFTPEERSLLMALARHCAQALDRARLFEDERQARAAAERTAERLSRLQALTSALSGASTRDEIADICIHQSLAALGASVGGVMLLSEEQKTLNMLAAYGVSDALISEFENFPLDRPSPLSDSIRNSEGVWISSLDAYRQRYPELASTTASLLQSQAFANLPLMIKGRSIGSIGFGFSTPQPFEESERFFMNSLAHQCAQALERARLSEQAQLAAAVEERQRLARDLHDAVSQTLFTASILAEALPNLWERNPARAREQSLQLARINRSALAEMRTLLLELRPATIANNTLNDLLRQLGQAIQGRRQIEVEVAVQEEGRLPTEAHITFYRIAQETLNNILKHAQATHVSVRLQASPERAELHIHDNGVGFDTEGQRSGLGLGMMQERARAIQAHVSITSAPGQGTEVLLRWQDEM